MPLGIPRPLVPAVRALRAIIVETFRYVEIKHVICVLSFHRMQSFHVLVAGGTAASGKPRLRVGQGPRCRH